MGIRYYDNEAGAMRIKRRYVWGFWAYLAGLWSAAVVFSILLH